VWTRAKGTGLSNEEIGVVHTSSHGEEGEKTGELQLKQGGSGQAARRRKRREK